jgi:hypothetical protein
MVTKTGSQQDGIECPRCGKFSPLDTVECSNCHLNFYPDDDDKDEANTEWREPNKDSYNQELQSKIESVPFGSKIIGIAASVAIYGFFMPWALVSCNGEPMVTMTGAQAATGGSIPTVYGMSDPLPENPILFVTLGASVLALLLFVIHYILRRSGVLISIFQVVLGILAAGSMALAWKKFMDMYGGSGEYFYVPVTMTVQTLYGFKMTAIGIAGIIIGGILSIADFSRQKKVQAANAVTWSNIGDQLFKLYDLYKSGQITEEEYDTAKSKVISGER